ncbi:unnamed protein product [Owenia fusiformis]|uniref:long-chain-fatty-acid--CoA ligase n=1 Tax=Owenia fusiformis TaxID=6347 RepID=A0A8J1XTS2_OWEFU|nr:unnamed protein product [Owenia fusiformis]
MGALGCLFNFALWAGGLGGSVGLLLYLIIKYKAPWIALDLKYLAKLGKTKKKLMGYAAKHWTMVDIFEQRTRMYPNKTFLIFGDEKYTYSEMNDMANKAGHAALECGLRRGDIAAVMIYNEPMFLATYLGLMKIGVQTAFLNFNLRHKSLQHCYAVSNAKVLIVGKGDELLHAIQEIDSDIRSDDMKIYVQGHGDKTLEKGYLSFDDLYKKAPTNNINAKIRANIEMQDPACYIYTSGTTGLPKAAVVTHSKVFKGGNLIELCGMKHDDVLYTGLPLYHSAAALIGVGNVVEQGATLVLSPKFSASKFWDDCRKHKVTVIQYIGEICRYLLAQPKRSNDGNNEVRIAFGNGLRPDVWKDFQQRFNIKVIGEFYAATEGNGGFINTFNKFAAVGRSSPFTGLLFPTDFIKYSVEQDEPVRDENGFCIRCKAGETGLMICKIKRDTEYDGYMGKPELTEKKIITDVFKKGDKYFNSGDLMSRDEEYFVYFKDRIGDTFRWKGENVSTIEVSNVISDLDCVEDANVYGVEVPGHDGRAGMAAITMKDNNLPSEEQLKIIYAACEDLLPVYARPRFLRSIKEMIITATFKQKKVDLVEHGFDPSGIEDPLYFMDTTKATYVPMDQELYKRIVQGEFRV